eukprot:1160783-Pelagomonas_calceolata.AAC.10
MINLVALTQVSQPLASRSSYTFIASKGPQEYTAYVCAQDTRGSRTCSTSTFKLLENSDFSAEEAEYMLRELGFGNLLSTGDEDAVYQVWPRAAALAFPTNIFYKAAAP